MPAELSILWDDTAILPAVATDRDIKWKMPRRSISIDIRTNAATDADISLVLTAFTSPMSDRTLLQPSYQETINLAKMNKSYQFISPFPMRILRATAYSPTGARLLVMVYDFDAKTNLGA